MCVHQHLWYIKEFLPKCYRCCSTWWYRVLFLHFSRLSVHLIKIPLYKLALSLIMNRNVHLIVYFPTPSVVVHRSHRQILTIKKINFRMKHPLSGFINWDLITNESLEKHVIENAFEDRLISFTSSQYGSRYSSFNRVYQFSVKFKHWIMIRLNYLDFFLSFSYIVNHIIFNFSSVSCKVIMQKFVLLRFVKLWIAVTFIEFLQQFVIWFFLIESKRVKICHISKMFPVLI